MHVISHDLLFELNNFVLRVMNFKIVRTPSYSSLLEEMQMFHDAKFRCYAQVSSSTKLTIVIHLVRALQFYYYYGEHSLENGVTSDPSIYICQIYNKMLLISMFFEYSKGRCICLLIVIGAKTFLLMMMTDLFGIISGVSLLKSISFKYLADTFLIQLMLFRQCNSF